MALEYGVEIVGISEAGSFRNFADRHVGLLKKFRRLIQTQTAQIGRNAAAGGSLENILNVRRGQTDVIGQRINIQLRIGIVALDIADDRVNIVASVVNAGKCTGHVLHQIHKQPLDCTRRLCTQSLRAEARGVIFHRHGIGTLERCDIFRNACNQQIQRIRHICCRFEPCVKEARKRCSGIVKALGAESLYYLTADLLCLCLAKGRTCIQLCAGNKVTGGIEIQQIQPLVQCTVGRGKLIDGGQSALPDTGDRKLCRVRECRAKLLRKRLRIRPIWLLTDKEEPPLQHIDQLITRFLRQRPFQLLLQKKKCPTIRRVLSVVRKLPLPELEQGYPMPDTGIGFSEMYQYGYTDGNAMLPLTKERAMELFMQDVPVFLLYGDNTEAMVLDAEDISSHTGVFGVEREEWDAVRGVVTLSEQADTEKLFLENPQDAFLIYQIRRGGELDAYRFMNYDYLQSKGITPERGGYDAIYTGGFMDYGNARTDLDMIYQRFNVDHPADFKGHSLSVSDIVALKQNGVVSCHYVDSIGFRELPNFLKPENYLKNAEMLLEDDYGMIDGISNNGPKQPTVADLEAQVKAGFSISLTELAAASHREQKKPSVLEKLRERTPEQSKNKTAPKRSAEREL